MTDKNRLQNYVWKPASEVKMKPQLFSHHGLKKTHREPDNNKDGIKQTQTRSIRFESLIQILFTYSDTDGNVNIKSFTFVSQAPAPAAGRL